MSWTYELKSRYTALQHTLQTARILWEEQDLGSFISCQRAGTVSPVGKHTLHSLSCSHPTPCATLPVCWGVKRKRVRAKQSFGCTKQKYQHAIVVIIIVSYQQVSNQTNPILLNKQPLSSLEDCQVHMCWMPSTSSQWRAVHFTPRLSVMSYLVDLK